MNDAELIDALKRDLKPSRPRLSLLLVGALWLCSSVLWVSGVGLSLGPMRPGVAESLAQHPLFLLEMLLGAGAVLTLAASAFRAAVPGRRGRGLELVGLGLLVSWVGFFLLGDVVVVLEPSMLGKREHCELEAYLLGLPPALLLLVLQHRRYPLEPARAALLGTTAAALLPALFMQLGCMYEPSHILTHHVAPVAVTALVLTAAVKLWPRRRARV